MVGRTSSILEACLRYEFDEQTTKQRNRPTPYTLNQLTAAPPPRPRSAPGPRRWLERQPGRP
eukprot:358380-Chlamydomonas_euryale.AAC.5